MMRRITIVALMSASAAVLACTALTNLSGLSGDGGSGDGGSDAAPPDADAGCNDAGFCACSKHDFCEDFDSYASVTDISQRWTNAVGYPPSIQLQGSSTFDAATPAVSLPNALQVRTEVVFGKAAASTYFVQVDGRPKHTLPIIGVKVTFQLRVDAIDPVDGAAPGVDGGASELVSVMSLISAAQSEGVGILLTEQGGYVGYALDLNNLLNSTVARGLAFTANKLALPAPPFFPFTVIVAPRNSNEVGGFTCGAGPVLPNGDGGTPDAAGGPNPLVVVVIPPLGVGAKVCEVLGGALLDPAWVQNPVLAIGSIQTGLGTFQAAFDNLTVDFLTE